MNETNGRTKRWLLALLAGSALPHATAASLWASVNLNTDSAGLNAGLGLLPVPFVGTLGLEGGLERPYHTPNTVGTFGVTLRDINLPATSTDAFVGAGLAFFNAPNGTQPYLEGGLRTGLLGPVGLKASARAYLPGRVRASLGAELRF